MKKWSKSFRIWHWLHALVVLSLIGTVLLRKTFLSYKTNSEILIGQLVNMDINITVAQAKTLAKAVRAPMWEWHILLGYALSVLLLIRLLLFFTQSGRNGFGALGGNDLHKKLVSTGYIGIYLVLTFMSMSGLLITFHQDLGLSKAAAHDIKEIHEAIFNVVWIFVVFHIGGLIVAENRDDQGLISDMINGGMNNRSM